MREIKIIGLDHYAKGYVGLPEEGYGFGMGPWPVNTIRNAANQGFLGMFCTAPNKLSIGVIDTAGQTKAGFTQLKLDKYLDSRTDITEFTIGMRVDPKIAAVTVAYNNIGIHTILNNTGGTGDVTLKLLATATAGTKITPGYYEFTFTLAASGDSVSPNKVEVFLDGVLISTQTLTNAAWNRTKIIDYYLTFGAPARACFNSVTAGAGGAVGDTLLTIEDWYVCYETSTPVAKSTRLGAIKVRQVPVATNLDTAWQTSDGSARAAMLNLANHHGNVTTPYMTSPASQVALSLNADTTVIADNETILAFSGQTSASRDSGQTASLKSNWKYNGVDGVVTQYLPTADVYTTQKDVMNLPFLNTMPDGTPLTKAKLANLQMIITPVG